MAKQIDVDKFKCEICSKEFSGDSSRLDAELCEKNHERLFISIYDFELPGLIAFFNTGNREFLPRIFLKKLYSLEKRALNNKHS